MKNIFFTIIALTAMLSACTPYKDLPRLNSMRDLNYPFEVKYAQINPEIEIAYTEKGQGETIILIHGLGSYSPAWWRNIDALSANFRVIAIDLPGYGKSSKLPHSGLMSFYADVVLQFMDKLNLNQVTLAGHSMGGQISMITALAAPERIKRLILVAPAGFETFHAGQRRWFKDIMSANAVRLTPVDAIENNLASNFYRVPREAHFMITDRIAMRNAEDFPYYCYAVSNSVGGMVQEPVLDKLAQIKQPTLILFGANDNLIPNRYLNPGRTVEIARQGAERIAGSKLVMVPKCGHFMMFEKPEVFNQEVMNFMK